MSNKRSKSILRRTQSKPWESDIKKSLSGRGVEVNTGGFDWDAKGCGEVSSTSLGKGKMNFKATRNGC